MRHSDDDAPPGCRQHCHIVFDGNATALDHPSDPAQLRPLRVCVAGGGIAGLEALMALRALAGQRVELTLIAPEDEFVYRPLGVEAPFAVGRSRRIRLDQLARTAGADFVATTVASVNPDQKLVHTSRRDTLEYDALVLAVGARPVPAVGGATTWDDRSDQEMLGGLLQDFEHGYSRRLAVMIPPGPVWPLRAYELALFITLEARGMSIDIETTIVTPTPSPLTLLGSAELEQLVSMELELAGITVASCTGAEVQQGHPNAVILQPSGRRLEVDRILALPTLHGSAIAGIPTRADGFVDVDPHCRVRGLDDVWAAGDGTAFPLKAGGFAAEQADVAAEDIAAAAGAAVQPRPFAPAGRGDLAGLPAGRFLEAWLAGNDDPALTTHLPAAGMPLATYLHHDLQASRRDPLITNKETR